MIVKSSYKMGRAESPSELRISSFGLRHSPLRTEVSVLFI